MTDLGKELTDTVTELLTHYVRNPHREVLIDNVEVVYVSVTSHLPARRARRSS